jgi:hypothetical protein
MHRAVLTLSLALPLGSLSLPACIHGGSASAAPPGQKVELYFGRSRAAGPIDDVAFAAFEQEVIRPRLPDGYTLLEGQGRYRGPDGVAIDEPSTVLVVGFASARALASRWRALEEIRASYCRRFAQALVLRIDTPARLFTQPVVPPP